MSTGGGEHFVGMCGCSEAGKSEWGEKAAC